MLTRLKKWLFGSDQDRKEGKAISETRKLSTQGSSYYINIPKEWFEKNNLEPEDIEELTLLANSDVLIINPNRQDRVKEKLQEKTFEIYQNEKKET